MGNLGWGFGFLSCTAGLGKRTRGSRGGGGIDLLVSKGYHRFGDSQSFYVDFVDMYNEINLCFTYSDRNSKGLSTS